MFEEKFGTEQEAIISERYLNLMLAGNLKIITGYRKNY